MRPSGYTTVEWLEQEIESARQALGTDPKSPVQIGVGFLCWLLEKDEPQGEKLLKAALDRHVAAIWLSFGAKLPKWIQFVRDHNAANGRRTLIFVQLASLEDALVAIRDWKVDVIVAQGFISFTTSAL